MPAHGRVRPRWWSRRLFGISIQVKRLWLRTARRMRSAAAFVPAWMVGTAAGTLAIMLAILLFFMRAPTGVAAATPTELQNPAQSAGHPPAPASVSPEFAAPRPTLAEVSLESVLQSGIPPVQEDPGTGPPSELQPPPAGQGDPRARSAMPDVAPRLELELVRTRLPFEWNQQELRTVSSQPQEPAAGWTQLARLDDDGWSTAAPSEGRADPFVPYLLRGASVPLEGQTVFASNRPGVGLSGSLASATGLELTKSVPEKAAVGERISYDIYVRNPTDAAIDGVVVRERMSSIHRVAAVAPVAAVQGDELVWSLGTMPAHDERKLSVTLVEDSAAVIETSATVTATALVGKGVTEVRPTEPAQPPAVEFESTPSARPFRPPGNAAAETGPSPAPGDAGGVAGRRPKLRLFSTEMTTLAVGGTLEMVFTVTNVGTADAEKVALYAELSDQLQHRYGRLVRHDVPRLAPGESHRAVLRAVPRATGMASIEATVTMDGREELSALKSVTIVNGGAAAK